MNWTISTLDYQYAVHCVPFWLTYCQLKCVKYRVKIKFIAVAETLQRYGPGAHFLGSY